MLGGARADWDQNTAERATKETKYHDRVCGPYPDGLLLPFSDIFCCHLWWFNEGLDHPSRRFTQSGDQHLNRWTIVPVTCAATLSSHPQSTLPRSWTRPLWRES